ncbi:MAG: hypothetical protein LUH15_07365 [Tannerellaceae bacterium]|nr:hypothetical protein [Tannerellaceae bacterium]
MNVPNGKHEQRSVNGTLLVEGQYNDGAQHGTWKYYNQDTSLRETIVYNNNEIKSRK